MSTAEYFDAVKAATKESVKELSKLLHLQLIDRGWPGHVAKSVRFVYEEDSFNYEFFGDYAEQAKTLEFGTERQRPTAEVRKFMGQTSLIEKVYEKSLEKRLGDLI